MDFTNVNWQREAYRQLPSNWQELNRRAMGTSTAIGTALQRGDQHAYDNALRASERLGAEIARAYAGRR